MLVPYLVADGPVLQDCAVAFLKLQNRFFGWKNTLFGICSYFDFIGLKIPFFCKNFPFRGRNSLLWVQNIMGLTAQPKNVLVVMGLQRTPDLMVLQLRCLMLQLIAIRPS